jgi:3-oxoacyl-[acyl-carrier-protein] synthase-1
VTPVLVNPPPVAAFRDASGEAALVCGTTAWNGLGFTPHQIWAFRRAEIAAHAETPFRLSEGQRATMLHVRTLPPRAQGVDRLAPILRRLVSPLLAQVASLGRPRAAIVLGLADRFADGGRSASGARRLEASIAADARNAGVEATVQIVARGHAGLAFPLVSTCSMLASGALDVALVGGVDTYYEAAAIDDLVREGRLFDGKNLEGFIPGEGGAFLLLARGDVARRAGWHAAGRVEALAASQDPAAVDMEMPITGAALTAAIRAIVDPLLAQRRTVDWWISDLTHEPDRVLEWQLTYPRASAASSADAPLDLLAPLLGDLGAAALPTAMVLATEGFLRGHPAARTCLASAASPGRERSAVLLAK